MYLNWIIIGSINDFSHIWIEAINWITVGFLSIAPWGRSFEIKIWKSFLNEMFLRMMSMQCKTFCSGLCMYTLSLQWRYNGRDGISNHQPHGCLLTSLFRRKSKKTSKLCITGLCVGNSLTTGEFPAQKASNIENVSIWWCYHVLLHWCQYIFWTDSDLGFRLQWNFNQNTSNFSFRKMHLGLQNSGHVFIVSIQ